MALRRSFMVLERADVAPALKKLWKKYTPVDGMVVQQLSPFEQYAVKPMFKDAQKKVVHKVSKMLLEAGPAVVTLIGVVYWAEWKHEDIAHSHRD